MPQRMVVGIMTVERAAASTKMANQRALEEFARGREERQWQRSTLLPADIVFGEESTWLNEITMLAS